MANRCGRKGGKKGGRRFVSILTALIATVIIIGMGGIAWADPYHVLSGTDVYGSYGLNGKSAEFGYINSIVGEGTSNAYETYIYFVDPTADNVILVPNTSGTLQLEAAAVIVSNITVPDGKMIVGSDSNVGNSVTPSGVWTISRAGVTSFVANTVDATAIGDNVITATQIAANAVTASEIADSTITSTQMAVNSITNSALAVDSVDTKSFDYNTVVAVMIAGRSYVSNAVEPGAVLLGAVLNSDAGSLFNGFSVSIAETNATGQQILVNTTARAIASGVATYKLNFLRP